MCRLSASRGFSGSTTSGVASWVGVIRLLSIGGGLLRGAVERGQLTRNQGARDLAHGVAGDAWQANDVEAAAPRQDVPDADADGIEVLAVVADDPERQYVAIRKLHGDGADVPDVRQFSDPGFQVD